MTDIVVSSIPCMRVFDEDDPADPDTGTICAQPSVKVHFVKLRPDPWWLGVPLCEDHGHEFSGSAILNEIEKHDPPQSPA